MAESVEFLHGEEAEDGILYWVHFLHPNYIVRITHPDGREMVESFICTYEPRFGPDAGDIQQAEEVMERLITEMRNG